MRFEGIIGIGLVLALAIGGVTVRLTKRTEVTELSRDIELVEEAVSQIQLELDRLHFRYVDRLEELAEELHRYARSTFPAERLAARLVGVKTISLINLRGESPNGHYEIRSPDSGSAPFDRERFPVLRSPSAPDDDSGEPTLVVTSERFEIQGNESGWVRNPDNVLYFWKRARDGAISVIGIDTVEVQASISDWLLEADSMGFKDLADGHTRLVDPRRKVVWDSGEGLSEGAAPRFFSATSRMGTWQIEASGRTKVTQTWNLPFLIAGVGLALAVFLASVLTALSLRRATRLAEQRVTFVNRVSHELRTPITNILLNTDIARDVLADDPADAKVHLTRVRDETSRLSRLVDNVLTFSRKEERGYRLRIAKIDPKNVIEEVAANFDSLFERAGIELSIDSDSEAFVAADPDALAQILTNLFSNAEKYAAAGGRLDIQTRIAEEHWTLLASDNGPGVKPGAREKIFEPFRRSGDSISEGVTGTGLGLTIARDLAREMSGDLKLVDSKQGATFELTLPLSTS